VLWHPDKERFDQQHNKNRNINLFLQFVWHLRPDYVLMENVMGLVTLSKGYLARSVVTHLLQHSYQVRQACVQCGQYGLAQDWYNTCTQHTNTHSLACQYRWSFFMIAAPQSQQLPHFPHPTHSILSWVASNTQVTQLSADLQHLVWNSLPTIFPPLSVFDTIGDLPAVVEEKEGEEKVGEGRRGADILRTREMEVAGEKEELKIGLEEGRLPYYCPPFLPYQHLMREGGSSMVVYNNQSTTRQNMEHQALSWQGKFHTIKTTPDVERGQVLHPLEARVIRYPTFFCLC